MVHPTMLRLMTAAVVIAAAVHPAAAGDAAGLVVNARIHTLESDDPRAEAMAWDADGTILALGESDALRERYPGADVLDLDGASVIPGLIDAHGHVMNLGHARLQVDLADADTLEETLDRLRRHAGDLPEDAWLTGRGWDQTRWPGAEFPSAADLDAVFPDRPVYLVRVDGHAAWVNSAAMERAGRDLAGDWQPDGGRIHRDAEGRPTGILVDAAMDLVENAMPPPDAATEDLALDRALAELARNGITGVHEAGTSQADLRRYLHRDAIGELSVRIHALADGDGELLDSLCRRGTVATDRVVARGVKYYADGALGSRGAALLVDYRDEPGNRGLLFETDEAMQALVNRAMGCGLQVAIHAIGDRANRQALDALAAGIARHPDNPGRHRIEHAQVIHLDDIPRFAELGVIASMQPIHATSDMRWAEARLGTERLAGAYAWRSLLEAGARLALGSDFPVEPVNPWLGIHAAVTRQRDGNPPGGWRPAERLSVQKALEGFTRDAAHAGFAGGRAGSLAVGKLADFLVLDADPFDVEPDRLGKIRVLRTVVGGKTVFVEE